MVPLARGISSRLRSAALVVGGIAVGVGVAVGAGSLTGGDDARPTSFGRAAQPEGSAPLLDPARLAEVEGPRLRAGSPAEAVEAFLAAEQAGDHATSFGYLADAVRVEYGSPSAWAADHPDALPTVLGFEVESPSSPDSPVVTTLTRYRSGLDAVTGFVPAQARTSWSTVQDADGWSVDVSATTQVPVLPADDGAVAAVQAWAERAQSCAMTPAQTAALRGRADLASSLCGGAGDVRAGDVRALAQADAAPLQTSFGADVVSWARTVDVDGPVPLRAVVAPLDDAWTVVGVLAPTGTGR